MENQNTNENDWKDARKVASNIASLMLNDIDLAFIFIKSQDLQAGHINLIYHYFFKLLFQFVFEKELADKNLHYKKLEESIFDVPVISLKFFNAIEISYEYTPILVNNDRKINYDHYFSNIRAKIGDIILTIDKSLTFKNNEIQTYIPFTGYNCALIVEVDKYITHTYYSYQILNYIKFKNLET